MAEKSDGGPVGRFLARIFGQPTTAQPEKPRLPDGPTGNEALDRRVAIQRKWEQDAAASTEAVTAPFRRGAPPKGN